MSVDGTWSSLKVTVTGLSWPWGLSRLFWSSSLTAFSRVSEVKKFAAAVEAYSWPPFVGAKSHLGWGVVILCSNWGVALGMLRRTGSSSCSFPCGFYAALRDLGALRVLRWPTFLALG